MPSAENSRHSFVDLLEKIPDDFENVETFIEADPEKSDRFKSYVKHFYDFLKVQEDLNDPSDGLSEIQPTKQAKSSSSSTALPELIVDTRLVDTEQIYQQLQLYNQDNSSSISSMTRFFAKCLVGKDAISFNLSHSKGENGLDLGHLSESGRSTHGTTTDNNDEEADEEEDDYEDEDDDESVLSDDSVDNLLKNSKIKLALNQKEKKQKEMLLLGKGDKNKDEKSIFGIPDGSDSEISDFEVEGEKKKNGKKNEEEDEDDEDDGILNEEDDEEDLDEDEIDLAAIESDEIDEELVDLYQNLGDEKKALGIGKQRKAFEDVDFDNMEEMFNEDADEEDGEGEEDEEGEDDEVIVPKIEDPKNKKKAAAAQEVNSKDLFEFDDKKKAAEEEELKGKSPFEIRQIKLQKQMSEIHDSMLNNVNAKPWQLKGEATAKSRPQDSLLEEFLEFDQTTRQAPVMNATSTETLETLIKQRVKDKAYDDVERKIKPVDMHYEHKKQVMLDHEKSQKGLGQVYEEEYLKQQEKAKALLNGEHVEDSINPKHEEIRKRLQSLFVKLDALSNFHYTPRAPVPEIKVITNIPTISMEEVAPINVAESNALAPEEIMANIKGLPKSKSEEDKTDKKRNLRAKKLVAKKKGEKKAKRLELAQAVNPDDPNIGREVAMNKLKKQAKNISKNITILKTDKKTKVNPAYRSSSAFFQQMQEGATTNLHKKKKKSNDSDIKDNNRAKKLKL